MHVKWFFATHFILLTCLTIIHVMYRNILSLISSVYIFNCLQIWVTKYFLKRYNFKECSWNAFGNVNKLTMTMDGWYLPIHTHVSWTRTSRVVSVSWIAGQVKYSQCRMIIFVFCCKYAYIWENNCPSPNTVDRISKEKWLISIQHSWWVRINNLQMYLTNVQIRHNSKFTCATIHVRLKTWLRENMSHNNYKVCC